jgi:hypothetical protein
MQRAAGSQPATRQKKLARADPGFPQPLLACWGWDSRASCLVVPVGGFYIAGFSVFAPAGILSCFLAWAIIFFTCSS